ncbi:lymphotactin-like isoform X2 [Rhinatrema bivittatum]|uniref:lymphotactin-like isoform X2 n=1 Tax=Rhinatrema bivittatum TaxID=194408 RepID=UPI00112BB41D|nr:lymphotactin-like isoform X2 [Rhinatrema bivittatum]
MKVPISLLVCISIYTVGTIEGPGGHQVKKQSCTEIKSNKPLKVARIKNFLQQETPIPAVMFITKKGIMICVNPELFWVQNAIKTLNARRRPQKVTQKWSKTSSRKKL